MGQSAGSSIGGPCHPQQSHRPSKVAFDLGAPILAPFFFFAFLRFFWRKSAIPRILNVSKKTVSLEFMVDCSESKIGPK